MIFKNVAKRHPEMVFSLESHGAPLIFPNFNESPLNLIFFQHILKFLGIFAPLGTQVAAENVGHNALRSCGKYLHSPRFPTVSRPNTPPPPQTTDDVEQMACLEKQYLFDVACRSVCYIQQVVTQLPCVIGVRQSIGDFDAIQSAAAAAGHRELGDLPIPPCDAAIATWSTTRNGRPRYGSQSSLLNGPLMDHEIFLP